ncbi:putative enhancer of rudimentary [Sporodiniella umbellata]|nr:putative enhancer of rudimentary [Sporodiniella umbellata]
MGNHTILLIQSAQRASSRNYHDFETESQAFDRIAEIYETQLAKENPNMGQIQYRAEDLFKYIDSHKEFVALVFDSRASMYQPHDKDWIKDRLIAHFSRQQAPAPSPGHQRRYNRRNY